jgi:hypothetical protein
MADFRVLLRIDLEHEFFADGRCRGLGLAPDAATARLLARPDLMLRCDAHGLAVAADAGAAKALAMLADDGAALVFSAQIEAPAFLYASEPFVAWAGRGRLLDAARAVAAGEGLRLHRGDVLTAADLAPDPHAEARRTLRPEPLFTIRIPLPAPRPEAAPLRYRLRFAARATHWCYHVLGRLRRDGLRIVDPDGIAAFAPLDRPPLADGRPTTSFRSAAPLVLAERPPQRFQLRAGGPADERILIRRLPVAGACLPGGEAAGTACSDIYVNG